jgi:toxin ParE1/3/4
MTSSTFTLSPFTLPEADQDFEDISLYLEERDALAAMRFADAVDSTVEMLCRSPDLGERLRCDPTGQIRYRTISGFRNYLIFYRRVDSILEIVRVLHGARDYEQLFE